MKIETKRLKSFLLDSGLLDAKSLEAAEKKTDKNGKNLQDELLGEGKLTEEDLSRLQAYILGIPYVDLEHQKIPEEILRIIPEPIARTHNIIAYKKDKSDLEVAMLDPEDLETIEFIKKTSNLKILPRLTNRASIKNAISQYRRSLEAEFGDIIKKEAKDVIMAAPVIEDNKESELLEDLKKSAEEIPIVKILDTLLQHAIVERASDIHIEPGEKEVVVRYRIDGILRDAMVLPKQVAPGIIARIKVLSSLKLDEHRLPQDGRFKIETNEERISFRVSILPVAEGEKAVMRILIENSKSFTLETLGFFADNLEKIHKAIKKPVGMVLATGPTGSGKTTTLYTVIDILNTPEVNISTIEDPVEYRMPRVNQTQVKPDIGFTFANGLRSLVRQDPDIIMVGEIRDNETASLAVNAALTGHLVLSTLHTNSAAGALPRLLDMKVEPFLIASTVTAIIGQRLVRKLYKSRKPFKLSKSELNELGKNIDLDRVLEFLRKYNVVKAKDDWTTIDFYKPEPTVESPDGYKDRIGIHEVLEVTETIKQLIMSGATSDDIEKQAKKEGMTTMFEEGIIKAVQGITTIEEVLRVTSE
ncbi:type II/IV secretion system protein [Candidatus Giovannonibacteria bacterium]|nr:type II/IV secretion system protein [Candidatus Giovannonibacteria bacterium]